MAMGEGPADRQPALFVASGDLARSPGHPFYDRLNELLLENGFDAFVEDRCRGFYAAKIGRPSMPPGVYFRSPLEHSSCTGERHGLPQPKKTKSSTEGAAAFKLRRSSHLARLVT
jgi:hypothetical protein